MRLRLKDVALRPTPLVLQFSIEVMYTSNLFFRNSIDRRSWIQMTDFGFDDYPFIRQVYSPVTSRQLRPLDPRCRVVQFDHPLTEADFRKLADFMQAYPHLPLRIYHHFDEGSTLDFLRFFPFLRHFIVDVYHLDDIAGLQHLPDNLESFSFGMTKTKRFSLGFLSRFKSLRALYLESQKKDISVVSQLTSLESLSLRSISLPDLSILLPMQKLLSLDIKLGGTRDLSLLPRIGKLRYLELWLIRGLTDLSMIGEITTLQNLFLESLKNVKALPSFGDLIYLRRVTIQAMKGLTDLKPIADAPNLEELLAYDMCHLQPASFIPFVGHGTLKAASVGLGSLKRNTEAERLLGLPSTPTSKWSFAYR